MYPDCTPTHTYLQHSMRVAELEWDQPFSSGLSSNSFDWVMYICSSRESVRESEKTMEHACVRAGTRAREGERARERVHDCPCLSFKEREREKEKGETLALSPLSLSRHPPLASLLSPSLPLLFSPSLPLSHSLSSSSPNLPISLLSYLLLPSSISSPLPHPSQTLICALTRTTHRY